MAQIAQATSYNLAIMDWRRREPWIIGIISGLAAIYLAEVIKAVVPTVAAWYLAVGWITDAVGTLSLMLFVTGLVWGAEPARRSSGGYNPIKHLGYAFGCLFFVFFGDAIERLFQVWDER